MNGMEGLEVIEEREREREWNGGNLFLNFLGIVQMVTDHVYNVGSYLIPQHKVMIDIYDIVDT